MSVAERIASNLALTRPVLTLEGWRRLAARHLFSTLADLEQIAVITAERGGGIVGQLEDEIVHRDTFAAIADALGGRVPTAAAVRKLTAFIEPLRGEIGLAVLNIVAERWLAMLFRHVGGWGIAPELFAAIGAEEARHSHEALALARPAPAVAEPYLRELELLLCEITVDPGFLFPLGYLGGGQRTAAMGLAVTDTHAESAGVLGLEPTPQLRSLIACATYANEEASEPVPVQLNPWQRSRFSADFIAPIYGWLRDVEITWRDAELGVLVAIGDTLARFPQLNVTLNPYRRELYRPPRVTVGVRRLYDRAGQITTLYVRDPQDVTPAELGARLVRKRDLARSLPFPTLPDTVELLQIAPPGRVAVTLTNLIDTGFDLGMPTLAGAEGAAFAVGLASKHDGKLEIGVAADHRAVDGRDLGLFLKSLRARLES